MVSIKEFPIVSIQNCTKQFDNLIAVNNISLEIPQGKFIALLGPNGAGKTTLVEMVENSILPTSGSILIKGMSWKKHEKSIKGILGVSLQNTEFFDKLTVLETTKLFATLYRIKDFSPMLALLKKLDLMKRANVYIPTLSGGEKQKLALIIALINDPDLLILDEPTTGLDPTARKEMWDILLRLKKEGKTLILTTHYMEEAESLCDYIYIMNQGSILTSGTIATLQKKHNFYTSITFSTKQSIDIKLIEKLPFVKKVVLSEKTRTQHTYTLSSLNNERVLLALLKFIENNQLTLLKISTHNMTLNDLFLDLTGRKLND